MFGRLMPREGRFFDYFTEHGDQLVLGARELCALMANVSELQERKRSIEKIEHRADKITQQTMQLLHATFITPLDRDEIHQLITRMDDILDLMQDVAESIVLYDIRKLTPETRQLAEICQMCCERVRTAVSLLKNVKDAEAILKTCQEIDRLESDADRVMRAAMSKLFREETDVRELIKLKTIYEQLESISDRCEDVANLIEGVVLENS